MSENGALVAQPAAPVAKRPRIKYVSPASVKLACADGKFLKFSPERIRAQARIGRFVEQEGEHHLARAHLANVIEEFSEEQRTWEDKAKKALEAQDDDKYERYMKFASTAREQVAKAAISLNSTRRKVDPGEAPMSNVPTMPARTVITNNTQINVNPKPEPNGNTT